MPWRIALVLVAATLIWLAVGDGIGRFFGPAGEDRLGHAVRAVLTSALVVPLILLARRSLDRRPWAGLGLTPLGLDWRPLLFGAMFWVLAAGLGLAVTLALGWARIDVGRPDAGIVLLALGLPALVLLYEALPEELIFRGYFFRNLAAALPRWLAVGVQAALFTLWGTLIGAAGSADRLVLFFTFSVVLGILRALTGNLWAGIGYHLAFQWVTQLDAAAIRDGVVQIEGQPIFDLVVFWLFPIILGSLVLVAWSVLRGTRWRTSDPDDPAPPAAPDRVGRRAEVERTWASPPGGDDRGASAGPPRPLQVVAPGTGQGFARTSATTFVRQRQALVALRGAIGAAARSSLSSLVRGPS